MASQPIACPQCQAPLGPLSGRRFCRCDYCGCKFAVELPDGESPRLARFESVLSATAGPTVLRDAQQRLADLELTLADAEDDVEGKEAELAACTSAYWRTRFDLQRLVAPTQNSTYVAGLLAAVAVFGALFMFDRPDRLAGLVAAVLLAATAWAFHREWQDKEAQGQGEYEEATLAIHEAQDELQSALACLEDACLERDLLQQQVVAAQGRAGASAT